VRLASGRTCAFYLAWFFRLYHATDSGWVLSRTPDDKPIMCQKFYFSRCMEVIAQTLGVMMAEERNKASRK